MLNGLLQNLLKNFILILSVVLLLHPQRIDLLLKVLSRGVLVLPGILMVLNQRKTFLFHVFDGIVELLLLVHARILITVLTIDTVHFALADDFITANSKSGSVDLALLVMVEDLDLAITMISSVIVLCLPDLLLGWHSRPKLEFLRHLPDVVIFGLSILLIFNGLMAFGRLILDLWIISDRLINQAIWMALELFEHLLADVLLPVNQIVRHSMMIVPHLPVLVVNLDKLPQIALLIIIGLLVRGSIMLNSLEQVRKTSSHHEFVLSVLIIETDLFLDQSFVVLEDGDSLHETVDLHAV